MNDKVTIDLILKWLQESIEQKRPVDAHTWVDSAQKMVILVGDESSKLYDIQQKVAQLKVARIEQGDSVAKAKVYVEASDEYKEMKQQEAKIERVFESVRISKIQAKLQDGEMRSY